jgi:arginyl-tRNA synthetase
MSLLTLLNQRFADAMHAIGVDGAAPLVQPATHPDFGDYQVNGAMLAAKVFKTNPRALARRIADAAKVDDIVAQLDVAGPGFINLRLCDRFLARHVETALSDPRLAVSRQPATRVMVEYSSVNLAKEMHIGHLRPTVIGDALSRIFAFAGHTVIRQNHVGDWGTPFGMLLAGLIDAHQDNSGQLALADLESFYRQAKQRFDSDAAFADRAREIVVRLQAGDEEIRRWWRQFVAISLGHCDAVYRKLEVLLNDGDVRGESFYNADLPHVVQALADRGLLTEQDGTRVVLQPEFKNREGGPLGFIVQKRDGGYLYSTTDLAAIRFRAGELKLDRCLYVVDTRQNLHFQQLFTLARKAGFAPDSLKLEHIGFGTVMGEDGKPFKTRSGDVVKLSDLLDEAQTRALALVRAKNPHLAPEEQQDIARTVGIGAVKYADLSKSRLSDYVFNWSHMLSLEGNTAPYLQYAHTRIKSLFRKIPSWDTQQAVILTHPSEHTLALELARFADAVHQVTRDCQPHSLCTYLHAVASAFSRFYEACPIMGEGRPDASRLHLCDLTARTLATGLGLLGIRAPERM